MCHLRVPLLPSSLPWSHHCLPPSPLLHSPLENGGKGDAAGAGLALHPGITALPTQSLGVKELAQFRVCAPLPLPIRGWERLGAWPRGGGCQVSFPGLWCHLPTSASLQASGDTLLACAEFLQWRKLSYLAKTRQTELIGECLVRTTPKPQGRAGPGLPHVPVRRAVWLSLACPAPARSPEPGAASSFPALKHGAPKGSSPGPSPLPAPRVLNKVLAHVSPGSGTAGSLHSQAPCACGSL